MQRRHLLQALLLAALPLPLSSLAASAESLTVYRDPNCGCCEGWVDHLREAGFEVKTVDATDLKPLRQRLGVPAKLEGCHTAVIDRTQQVVEGHVPARAVKKLLSQPKVKGIAVPGMPMNSPGMGKLDGTLVTLDFKGRPFSKD